MRYNESPVSGDLPLKWEKAAGGPTENQLREVTGAGAGRGPALHTLVLLIVKAFVREPDFRKSVVCFFAAAVLKAVGRALVTARETGVGIFQPVLYRTGKWRWKSPWTGLLSAIIGLIIALLTVPLESINLLGYLLEEAGGNLRVSGNSHISRWAVRHKRTAEGL